MEPKQHNYFLYAMLFVVYVAADWWIRRELDKRFP